MHRMFVYGTLKRGQPNHHLITGEQFGKAEFVGQGRTVEKYPLVIGTPYNIPFMLDSPGTGKAIYGDVYDVDDKMLKRLDELENHPKDYLRTNLDVDVIESMQNEQASDPQDSKTLRSTCQGYLLPNFKETLLTQPFLDNYKNHPDKNYLPRAKRDPAFSVSKAMKKEHIKL